MMLKALIVEQLESDGTLRSLKMQPAFGPEITVAFCDEYDEPRDGPFHFLSQDDEHLFREGFANCRARRVGRDHFYLDGESFHFSTSWSGIPTERNWVSYYALSLPEYAVPERLSITDPHRENGREYRRTVKRDDKRRRYVIYLECASSLGRFDFALACDFKLDERRFADSAYEDAMSGRDDDRSDAWEHFLPNTEASKVHQFFIGSVQVGDHYSIGQAGVAGRNARAEHTRIDQRIGGSDEELKALASELTKLRTAMKSLVTTAEQAATADRIASAALAAARGDREGLRYYLKSAGKWALDVATNIGTDVAAAALKSYFGS